MRFSDKAKYFTFGIAVTAVVVSFAARADKTIPIKFSEGDVISANVMNALLKRVSDTQGGFSSNNDLIGTWSCTSYTTRTDCTSAWTNYSPILMDLTQDVVITANGSILSFAAATTNLGDCTSLGPGRKTLDADVIGNNIALVNTASSLRTTAKITNLSPTSFHLDYAVNVPGDTFASCEKVSTVPSPADALTATVSGTSVTLTWTDNSTNETGFTVEYKTSDTGTWTSATTTTANETSYTVSGLTTGTYWFRVIATNGYGDAMSSSEVQAVIK